MGLLSKDQIFAVDDRKIEEVYVPEWGGHVRIRSLSGRERDRFEAEISGNGNGKKPNAENFRARFIALCVLEPGSDTQPMFANRHEVAMLGSKTVGSLQRIFNKCQELNGMSDDDVKDMTEDFDEAPDESSTSD